MAPNGVDKKAILSKLTQVKEKSHKLKSRSALGDDELQTTRLN